MADHVHLLVPAITQLFTDEQLDAAVHIQVRTYSRALQSFGIAINAVLDANRPLPCKRSVGYAASSTFQNTLPISFIH